MSDQSLAKIILAIGFLGGLGAAGCAPPADAVATPAPPVVLVAEAKSPGGGKVAVGRVVSRTAFAVSSETGGRVVRITARVGDRVEKGQTLATLDGAVAIANATAARADLTRAERASEDRQIQLERVRKLLDAGVASRAEFEAAESEAVETAAAVAAARAALEAANKSERDVTLRAPADGTIAARHVELAQAIAPGAVAFELDGGGDLEIEAMIAESALEDLEAGASVTFTARDGRGTAEFIGAARRTGAGGARLARFRIISGNVAPGAAVDLQLRAGSRSGGALVPLGAVLTSRDGTRRVLVVENDTLVERPVTLSSLSGIGAVVVGLEPGDAVVAAGGEFMTAGSRIRPASTLR